MEQTKQKMENNKDEKDKGAEASKDDTAMMIAELVEEALLKVCQVSTNVEHTMATQVEDTNHEDTSLDNNKQTEDDIKEKDLAHGSRQQRVEGYDDGERETDEFKDNEGDTDDVMDVVIGGIKVESSENVDPFKVFANVPVKWKDEEDEQIDSTYGSLHPLPELMDCNRLGEYDEFSVDPDLRQLKVYSQDTSYQSWNMLDPLVVEETIAKAKNVSPLARKACESFYKYLRSRRKAQPSSGELVSSYCWIGDIHHKRLRRAKIEAIYQHGLVAVTVERLNCGTDCYDCELAPGQAILKFNNDKDQLLFAWAVQAAPPADLTARVQDEFTTTIEVYRRAVLANRNQPEYLMDKLVLCNQDELNRYWYYDTDTSSNGSEDELQNIFPENILQVTEWPPEAVNLKSFDRIKHFFHRLAWKTRQANEIDGEIRKDQISVRNFKKMAAQLKSIIQEYKNSEDIIRLIARLRQDNSGPNNKTLLENTAAALNKRFNEYIVHLKNVHTSCVQRAATMMFDGREVKVINNSEEISMEDCTDEDEENDYLTLELAEPNVENISRDVSPDEVPHDTGTRSKNGIRFGNSFNDIDVEDEILNRPDSSLLLHGPNPLHPDNPMGSNADLELSTVPILEPTRGGGAHREKGHRQGEAAARGGGGAGGSLARRDSTDSSHAGPHGHSPGSTRRFANENNYLPEVDDMVRMIMNQMRTTEMERQTREDSLEQLRRKREEEKEKERKKREEEKEKERKKREEEKEKERREREEEKEKERIKEAERREEGILEKCLEKFINLELRMERRLNEFEASENGSVVSRSTMSSRASRRQRNRTENWSVSPPRTPSLPRAEEPGVHDEGAEDVRDGREGAHHHQPTQIPPAESVQISRVVQRAQMPPAGSVQISQLGQPAQMPPAGSIQISQSGQPAQMPPAGSVQISQSGQSAQMPPAGSVQISQSGQPAQIPPTGSGQMSQSVNAQLGDPEHHQRPFVAQPGEDRPPPYQPPPPYRVTTPVRAVQGYNPVRCDGCTEATGREQLHRTWTEVECCEAYQRYRTSRRRRRTASPATSPTHSTSTILTGSSNRQRAESGSSTQTEHRSCSQVGSELRTEADEESALRNARRIYINEIQRQEQRQRSNNSRTHSMHSEAASQLHSPDQNGSRRGQDRGQSRRDQAERGNPGNRRRAERTRGGGRGSGPSDPSSSEDTDDTLYEELRQPGQGPGRGGRQAGGDQAHGRRDGRGSDQARNGDQDRARDDQDGPQRRRRERGEERRRQEERERRREERRRQEEQDRREDRQRQEEQERREDRQRQEERERRREERRHQEEQEREEREERRRQEAREREEEPAEYPQESEEQQRSSHHNRRRGSARRTQNGSERGERGRDEREERRRHGQDRGRGGDQGRDRDPGRQEESDHNDGEYHEDRDDGNQDDRSRRNRDNDTDYEESISGQSTYSLGRPMTRGMINNKIRKLDKEYEELKEKRKGHTKCLDRSHHIEDNAANVTVDRALENLGETEYGNMAYLEHMITESDNRIQVLQLIYRRFNNLTQSQAMENTSNVEQTISQIYGEIKTLNKKGIDQRKEDIANMASIILEGKTRVDWERATGELSKHFSALSGHVAKLKRTNRALIDAAYDNELEFYQNKATEIMKILDPINVDGLEDKNTIVYLAFDYFKAAANTAAGMKLMIKAKNLEPVKISPVLEKVAMKDLDSAKNKLSGDTGNPYTWKRNMLGFFAEFKVKEESQPRLILNNCQGQAADVIRKRVEEREFKSGLEVIDELMLYYGNKEKLIDNLADRHISIGKIFTEDQLEDKGHDLETIRNTREQKCRAHKEVIEEVENLLEAERIEKKLVERTAILLVPKYLTSLHSIFPSAMQVPKPIGRDKDRMEAFKIMVKKLSEEAKDAIEATQNTPAALSNKGNLSKHFFSREGEVKKDATGGTDKPSATGIDMTQMEKLKNSILDSVNANIKNAIGAMQQETQQGWAWGRGGAGGAGRGGRGRGARGGAAGAGARDGERSWDVTQHCQPCRGKDGSIVYHASRDEANNCQNWKYYYNNNDAWLDLCGVCHKTRRLNNVDAEVPVKHYQEKGWTQKYSCPITSTITITEAADYLDKIGHCKSCLTTGNRHGDKANYDKNTNSCNRKRFEPCQNKDCKLNITACKEHHSENIEELKKLKLNMKKYNLDLNISLPVLTEIEEEEVSVERVLPINMANRPFMKKQKCHDTAIDKLLGPDNRGVSSVVQIEALDGSSLTLLHDNGAQVATFCDKVCGTAGGLPGECPLKDKQVLLSGLTGEVVSGFGVVMKIPVKNEEEEIIVPGTMSSYMPDIQEYYFDNHLTVLKEEAKHRGMDIDYIQELAQHGGKIQIILGTRHEKYFPNIIYESPTGMRLTKSKINTGRFTPYSVSGVFPTLQTLTESVENMRRAYDRERLLTVMYEGEEEKINEHQEEEDCIEEIEINRESNQRSEELNEISKIFEETPEFERPAVIRPKGNDLVIHSKVFHCIPSQSDYLSMDILDTDNVEEFLEWRLKNVPKINNKLITNKDRNKAILSAMDGRMLKIFGEITEYSKHMNTDELLAWMELQIVSNNKKYRDEAEAAMEYIAEEENFRNEYEPDEEEYYYSSDEEDECGKMNDDEDDEKDTKHESRRDAIWEHINIDESRKNTEDYERYKGCGNWQGEELFEKEDEKEDFWGTRYCPEECETVTEEEWRENNNSKKDANEVILTTKTENCTNVQTEENRKENYGKERITILGEDENGMEGRMDGICQPEPTIREDAVRASGGARDLRLKIRQTENKTTTILELLQFAEDVLVSDYHNISSCSSCAKANCPKCKSGNTDLKISLKKLAENCKIRNSLWLNHEKKRVEFRYVYDTNWHKHFVCNQKQAFQNCKSIIQQCNKISKDAWKEVHDKFMEFEKKGYIRFTDEIEEWGELMDHCDKNWVKGGLFCLFTIVMKHTSLSSKIRPAADLKRNGPMGWSLNDFAQAGSSQFSMVEFAILSCLFPHFSTSDHANYYNSMHLDKIQWPTMQILIPPADGSLNPANWRKACLTRGWYGHISMSLFCIMAKEEIMKQMNFKNKTNSYVDDISYSDTTEEQVEETMGKYLKTMEEWQFKNKGCVFSRREPPPQLVDKDGLMPVMAFLYKPIDDTVRIIPKIIHAQDTKKTKVLKRDQIFNGETYEELLAWQQINHPEFTLRMQASMMMHYYSSNGINQPLLTGFKTVNRKAIALAKEDAIKNNTKLKAGKYFDFVLPKELVEEHLKYVLIMKKFEKFIFPRCSIKPGTLKYPENPKFQLHMQADGSEIANHVLGHTYHQLKCGKYQTNFAISNIGLSKLRANTAEGPKPHPQIRQEVESLTKAATIAKSMMKYLEPKGCERKYLFSDSATAIHLVVSEKAKLDQYLVNRISAIREVFTNEEIFWVPGEKIAADTGTRPILDAEACSPNSNFYNGMEWQRMGLSIKEAEDKLYIIKACNVSKIYEEKGSCEPEELQELTEEEINQKMRKFGPLERSQAAGLDVEEKKKILLKNRETENTNLQNEKDTKTEKLNKILTTTNTEENIFMTAILKTTNTEKNIFLTEEKCAKITEIFFTKPEELKGGDTVKTIEPVYQLLPAITKNDTKTDQEAKHFLVSNILKQRLDKSVASLALVFKSIHEWWNLMHKNKKWSEPENSFIEKKYKTEKSFLTDLLFHQSPGQHLLVLPAFSPPKLKKYLRRCPQSPKPPPMAIYKWIKNKEVKHGVLKIAVDKVENWNEMIELLFRSNWAKYPGVVRGIRCCQILMQKNRIKKLEPEQLLQRVSAACFRFMSIAKSNQRTSDLRRRPGLTLLGKLLVSLMHFSLNQIQAELRCKLMKFDEIEKSGFIKQKSTKLKVEMVHFWGKGIKPFLVKPDDVMRLPYYSCEHANFKTYSRLGEVFEFSRQATKYLIIVTQQAHISHLTTKEKKVIGWEEEGILLSHRKLKQDVNLAELVNPQSREQWESLSWLTIQQQAVYLPRGSVLAWSLMMFIHYAVRSGPLFLGLHTKHRGLAHDLAILRCFTEIHGATSAMKMIKDGCQKCINQEQNTIKRLYGSMLHELRPNYQAGTCIFLDVFGPLVTKQPKREGERTPKELVKFWYLGAVCPVTQITRLKLMENKTVSQAENALSMIFHSNIPASVIYVDQDSSFLKLLKEGKYEKTDITLANSTTFNFEVRIIGAENHTQNSYVEGYFKHLRRTIHSLDLKRFHVPITLAMRMGDFLAELKNTTPYAVRSTAKNYTLLELICPNNFLGKFKRGTATGPIFIPDSIHDIAEVASDLFDQVNTIYRTTHTTAALAPRSNFLESQTKLAPGDLIAWTDNRQFHPVTRFARIEKIEQDRDGEGRNAHLTMINKSKKDDTKINVCVSFRHLRNAVKIPLINSLQDVIDEYSLNWVEDLSERMIVIKRKKDPVGGEALYVEVVNPGQQDVTKVTGEGSQGDPVAELAQQLRAEQTTPEGAGRDEGSRDCSHITPNKPKVNFKPDHEVRYFDSSSSMEIQQAKSNDKINTPTSMELLKSQDVPSLEDVGAELHLERHQAPVPGDLEMEPPSDKEPNTNIDGGEIEEKETAGERRRQPTRQVKLDREQKLEEERRVALDRAGLSLTGRGRAGQARAGRGRAGRGRAGRGRAGRGRASSPRRNSVSPSSSPRHCQLSLTAPAGDTELKDGKYLNCVGVTSQLSVIEQFGETDVATKILQKYGFQPGQGLGKHGQGMPQALRVEKITDRGGVIVAGDKAVDNRDLTMVPSVSNSKSRTSMSFISFVPAPENKNLKPLQNNGDFAEKMISKHFAALSAPLALPANPYFDSQARRRRFNIDGPMNRSADEPPNNPYFQPARTRPFRHRQHFIRFYNNVTVNSPVLDQGDHSIISKNNNNRFPKIRSQVNSPDCCRADVSYFLTQGEETGRVPAWRGGGRPAGYINSPPAHTEHSALRPGWDEQSSSPRCGKPGGSPGHTGQGMTEETGLQPYGTRSLTANWDEDAFDIWAEEENRTGNPPLPHREAIATADIFLGGRLCEACEFYGKKRVHSGEESLACPNIKFMLITHNQLGQIEFCRLYEDLGSWYNMTVIMQRNELNTKISKRMWAALASIGHYTTNGGKHAAVMTEQMKGGQLTQIIICPSCLAIEGLTKYHGTEYESRHCHNLMKLTDIFLQSDPMISGSESAAMIELCKLVKKELLGAVMMQIAELVGWMTHGTFVRACKDQVEFELKPCQACDKQHRKADILKPDGHSDSGLGCKDATRFWTEQRYLASKQSKEVLRKAEREFLHLHPLSHCKPCVAIRPATVDNPENEIKDTVHWEVEVDMKSDHSTVTMETDVATRRRKSSGDIECGACEYSDSEDEGSQLYSPNCKGKTQYWARRARRSCLAQTLLAMGQLGIGIFVVMLMLSVTRADQEVNTEENIKRVQLLMREHRMYELDPEVENEWSKPDQEAEHELHELDTSVVYKLHQKVLDPEVEHRMYELVPEMENGWNKPDPETEHESYELDLEAEYETYELEMEEHKQHELEVDSVEQNERNQPEMRLMLAHERGPKYDWEADKTMLPQHKQEKEEECSQLPVMMVPAMFFMEAMDWDLSREQKILSWEETLKRSTMVLPPMKTKNVWTTLKEFFYSNQMVWGSTQNSSNSPMIGAGQEAIIMILAFICSGTKLIGPQAMVVASLLFGPWAEAARMRRAVQDVNQMPLWVGEEHALVNQANGEKVVQSWRAVTGFDTSGYYTGQTPTVHLLSLVEYGQCKEAEKIFMEPIMAEVQASHVLEHEEVTVAVCSVHIEYKQLWCTTDIYSHREAEIVIVPKRRLIVPAEQCIKMYTEGSATLKVYERAKNIGNELDTVLFLANISNGTINTVDLLAGEEHEDNACSGSNFAFMGQRYDKNLLYRFMTISVERYSGEYYDLYDKVVVRNLVDIPSGKDSIQDDKFGTLVVVSELNRKKEKCQRATELFTGQATIHPRVDDENKGIAFVQKDGQDTSFVITGRMEGCGRIIWETSVRSVLLLPITPDNPKLEVQLQDKPDLISEVKHQLAATAASTVYQLQQNFAGIASNECKLKQNAEANFKTTLMVANQEQLGDVLLGASLSNGGSALSLVQGIPVTMKFRNHKPSKTSTNLCCKQLPVVFKNHKEEQVFAFLEPISRKIVEHCTPLPCSQNHPIVLAIPSTQEVEWLKENPDGWTWQLLVERGFEGEEENNLFYACNYGDGRGLVRCSMPEVPKLFNDELNIPVGWSSLLKNLKNTMWDASTEQAEYEVQRDQANHAVLQRELVAMAGGHVITGGMTGQLIDNAPPEVKASIWDSIFKYTAITEPGTTANNLLIGITFIIGTIIILIGAVICCNIWQTVQLLWYSMMKTMRNCCRTRGLLMTEGDDIPMVRPHRAVCEQLDNLLILIGALEQKDIENKSRIENLERGLEMASDMMKKTAAPGVVKAEAAQGSLPSAPPAAVPAGEQSENKAKIAVTLED